MTSSGFADILGLDPLYMGNEGKMIAVVRPKHAQKALEAMRNTEHGRDAAIIKENYKRRRRYISADETWSNETLRRALRRRSAEDLFRTCIYPEGSGNI